MRVTREDYQNRTETIWFMALVLAVAILGHGCLTRQAVTVNVPTTQPVEK
jgi:hypothetical protein